MSEETINFDSGYISSRKGVQDTAGKLMEAVRDMPLDDTYWFFHNRENYNRLLLRDLETYSVPHVFAVSGSNEINMAVLALASDYGNNASLSILMATGQQSIRFDQSNEDFERVKLRQDGVTPLHRLTKNTKSEAVLEIVASTAAVLPLKTYSGETVESIVRVRAREFPSLNRILFDTLYGSKRNR